MTDSRFADLLQDGADALSPRTTPPGGWQPPSVEDLQKALPQYEISEFIACGGMGAVYKGTQKTLKRTMAIKILPPEIEDGEAHYAERFKHEAQAMARLSHPNIVAVFDAGEVVLRDEGSGMRDEGSGMSDEASGGNPSLISHPSSLITRNAGRSLLYFVMEFIEGTDVAQLIASEGQLDARRTVQIITAVCDALAFAHEEGIIHRDIKPSNIMLDRKGRVKVADFGLAKTINLESTMLTGSNVAMGTPDFIAPEALIAGTLVDGRADLYAVGVMLYQMLTGKIPRGRFDAPSRTMPKVDKGFDAIVDKAMQTDRDRRYSTASALRTDIEKVAKKAGYNNPSSPQQPSAANPPASRNPPLMAAAGLVVLAAGGWVATKVLTSTDATESKPAGVSSSPNLPLSKSSASEPAAIRLWDSAVKMPTPSSPGVSWDDDALHISKGNSIAFTARPSSDAILRASVRMNAGLENPQLCLRFTPHSTGKTQDNDSFYYLKMDTAQRKVSLVLSLPAEYRILKTWPLPRLYGPEEWIRLEIKMIGHELSASIDGTMLGSVEDSTLSGPGFVMLFANANAYFRDIEYVPLDKPPVTSSPTLPISKSPAEPAAIKLWDTPDNLPQSEGVSWDDGALRVGKQAVSFPMRTSPGAIARASGEIDDNTGSLQLSLRIGNRDISKDSRSYYMLNLSVLNSQAALKVWQQGKIQRELQMWDLPGIGVTHRWVAMELKMDAGTITVSVDGKVLGTVPEALPPDGFSGLTLSSSSSTRFREIEYVPLHLPPAAKSSAAVSKSSATPATLSVVSSVAAKADAIWKSRWSKPGRLRGLGVDGDGKPIDLSAAGDHADFVMVSNFAHGSPFRDGRRWVALRANGDAVYSDGTIEQGCIGLSLGSNLIMADGRARSRVVTAPSEPVLALRASQFEGLQGKPWMSVWQRLDGTWMARCTGYDDGKMTRPDLTTGAEVKKADGIAGGLGVLRTDGSFRLWGVREIPLPPNAAEGVKDFVTIGRQMVLLRTDGSAWTLSFSEASATNPSPEPTLRPSGNGITAIANGGFSAMFQKIDGTWFPGFTTDAAFTDALAGFKKSGVTHFSAANNNAKISLLWIEPAK